MPTTITRASSVFDLEHIIELQSRNHHSILNEETKKSQGFLMVRYDTEFLLSMHKEFPSVVAKNEKGKLVGYIVLMPTSFCHEVEILSPFYKLFDTLQWNGKLLGEYRWFVIGQVCVDACYRGEKLLDRMYEKVAEISRENFDFVLTEIAAKNLRSIAAHTRIGFKIIHTYDDKHTGLKWHVVLWDFTKKK